MEKHKKTWKQLLLMGVLSLSLVGCYESSSDGGPGIGTGGSLNRFTIADSFLYVINLDHIETYLIDQGDMEFKGATRVDNDIETVFPFGNLVLVGGQAGMYICERGTDGVLVVLSSYEHIMSCDPVVTDGQYAYVTLSSGCGNQADQLDIVDVSDVMNPVVVRSYPMYHPKGLGVDGELLFICDTDEGLKVYDRSDPVNIELIRTFDHLVPFDVIPYRGLLFVMTNQNIHQFDYSDKEHIVEVSVTGLK
jgi:hypothetical protein